MPQDRDTSDAELQQEARKFQEALGLLQAIFQGDASLDNIVHVADLLGMEFSEEAFSFFDESSEAFEEEVVVPKRKQLLRIPLWMPPPVLAEHVFQPFWLAMTALIDERENSSDVGLVDGHESVLAVHVTPQLLAALRYKHVLADGLPEDDEPVACPAHARLLYQSVERELQLSHPVAFFTPEDVWFQAFLVANNGNSVQLQSMAVDHAALEQVVLHGVLKNTRHFVEGFTVLFDPSEGGCAPGEMLYDQGLAVIAIEGSAQHVHEQALQLLASK